MIGHDLEPGHTLGDLVGQNVNGQRQASVFLESLVQHYPHADALFIELRDAFAEPERARGFCRALQKRLEASA